MSQNHKQVEPKKNLCQNRHMISRMLRAGLVVAVAIVALPVVAFAQHTSPNYEVDEIFIGSGGELEMCSDGYCAQGSAGGTGGQASSDKYGIMAGFGSPDEPTLSVAVTGSTLIDMGVLNISGTAAASTSFTVASYLSEGYVVRVLGTSPTNVSGAGTHSLTALNAPNESVPGTEQFGINLVANSNPGIGVNPIQQPDSSFSYGMPEIGYDQPDYFKYVDGDVVAKSEQASGQTDYTMSIIANIATSTPGGRYRTTLVIQAIATF